MALTCRTSLLAANTPGDYVWCKYTAASGVVGVFSDIATKIDVEVSSQLIPVASTATPNGYFKFILVGYDRLGRKKFVADRNVQHTISWDSLNTAGIASGGVPASIDGKTFSTIRLLSGGISSFDRDNEWDKIVAESTLGGTITAGDNAVWNWSGIGSSNSTRSSSVNTQVVARGNTTVINRGSIDTTYTTVGFRPVLLVADYPLYFLFLTENGEAYKYEEAQLVQVADDWDSLSAEDKETLYLAASKEFPPMEILLSLGTFKIMTYTNYPEPIPLAGRIDAVPKDHVVLPKGLIPLEGFEGIDSATVTAAISGSGSLVMAVTTDLITYKVYNGGTWAEIDVTGVATFKSGGMTPATLAAITRTGWDALTAGKQGIGFAYLPTIETVSDICSIDKITLLVDMKGAWNRAIYGTDFTYGYPKNNLLRVTLLSNGDYKINYYESAS